MSLSKEGLIDLINNYKTQLTDAKVAKDKLTRTISSLETTIKNAEQQLYDLMAEDGVLEEEVGKHLVTISNGRGSLKLRDDKTLKDVPNHLIVETVTQKIDKVSARRELTEGNTNMINLNDIFEVVYEPTIKIKEL
jgi:hypothetical protein